MIPQHRIVTLHKSCAIYMACGAWPGLDQTARNRKALEKLSPLDFHSRYTVLFAAGRLDLLRSVALYIVRYQYTPIALFP
jgi:hypothetical protein